MTCILVSPSDSFIHPLTALAIKKDLATCEDDVLSLTYRNGSKRDALYDFTDQIEKKLESEHIAGNLCCGLVAGIYGKEAVDPVTNNDFGSIVAGLILIFPEIRWYFLDVGGLPSILDESDERQRSLFSPLFDADGVRSELIGKATGDKIESKPPDCVVVEDELNFCFYHSYVAYRTGYRVLPVSSFKAFKNVENWFPGCTSLTVLIEDMSLAFFDKEEKDKLISLKKRDEYEYGTISRRAKLRALVTSGQPPSDENAEKQATEVDNGSEEISYEDALKKNREYLQGYQKGCLQKREKISPNTQIKCTGQYFAEELKPVGGMFRLIERLALEKLSPRDNGKSTNRGDSHSAPGMVQAIVEVMLSRVRRLRGREGLSNILLGSVLSKDALKLLGGKAPMLRFDALFSQHENEVRAESNFIDIGPVRDVEQRLKEISKEIEKIAEACQKENRRGIELQAQATLAHRMMLVFRNAAQYDEELVCLNYLRKAQRCLKRLSMWDSLKRFAQKTWDSLKRSAQKTRDSLKRFVQKTWDSLKRFVSWDSLKRFVSWDSLKRFVQKTRDSLKRFVQKTRDSLKRFVSWDSLKENLRLSSIVSSIVLLPRTYAELLVSGGYWRPILAMVGWVLFLSVGDRFVDRFFDGYGRLILAMVGWLLGVAIVYWRPIRWLVGLGLPLSLVGVAFYDIPLSDTTAATWKSIASHFFEAAAAPKKSVDLSENIFGLYIVLIGIFHIGVFISFVFSRLMRR